MITVGFIYDVLVSLFHLLSNHVLFYSHRLVSGENYVSNRIDVDTCLLQKHIIQTTLKPCMIVFHMICAIAEWVREDESYVRQHKHTKSISRRVFKVIGVYVLHVVRFRMPYSIHRANLLPLKAFDTNA